MSASDPKRTLSANIDILIIRGASRSASEKPTTAHGASGCETGSKFPETAKPAILGDGHGASWEAG